MNSTKYSDNFRNATLSIKLLVILYLNNTVEISRSGKWNIFSLGECEKLYKNNKLLVNQI